MTQVKRRLTDIKFEHEGAHVALVGKHQGGPANGIPTLVFKATSHIDPAEVALALAGQSAEQPLTIIEEPIVEQIEKAVHEELLNKAVLAAVEVEKAAFAAQADVLKAAQEALEVFKAKEAEAVITVRKAALTAVVADDQVEALMKSLAPLDAEAFDAVVASFAVSKALADQSDMLVETGISGLGAEDAQEVDRTTEILKAKYGNKAAK